MTGILLNDYYLQSFVDKALSREESARVWQAILTSPGFRLKYEVLVEQKRILLKWWHSLTQHEQAGVLS